MHLYRMARFRCVNCQTEKLHDIGRATDGKVYRCCICCGLATEFEDSAGQPSPQVTR